MAADAPAARRTGVRRVGRDTRIGAESERIREDDRRGGEGEDPKFVSGWLKIRVGRGESGLWPRLYPKFHSCVAMPDCPSSSGMYYV